LRSRIDASQPALLSEALCGRITVQRAVRHSTAEVHEALFADHPPAGAPVKTLSELKQGIRQYMQRKHAGR
jgi:hypothetical protein